MSWQWGTSLKNPLGVFSSNQPSSATSSRTSLTTSQPSRPTVIPTSPSRTTGFSPEKPPPSVQTSGFASFVSSLEKKAAEMNSDSSPKSVSDKSASLKSLVPDYTKKPNLSFERTSQSSSSSRGFLDTNPRAQSFSPRDLTSVGSSGLDYTKKPAFVSGIRSTSPSSVAGSVAGSISGSYLNEKPPSTKGLDLRFDTMKAPDFKGVSADTKRKSDSLWSTTQTPSRSVASFSTADTKMEVDDEIRLNQWDAAVDHLDREQTEVMLLQWRLFREQVATLATEGQKRSLDIGDLFNKCEQEASERREAIEALWEELHKMRIATTESLEAETLERTTQDHKIQLDIEELRSGLSEEKTSRGIKTDELDDELSRLKHHLEEDLEKTTNSSKEKTASMSSRVRGLESELDRLRNSLEEDIGKKSMSAKEQTASIATRVRETEVSLQDLTRSIKSQLEAETRARIEGDTEQDRALEKALKQYSRDLTAQIEQETKSRSAGHKSLDDQLLKLRPNSSEVASKADLQNLKRGLDNEHAERVKIVKALEEQLEKVSKSRPGVSEPASQNDVSALRKEIEREAKERERADESVMKLIKQESGDRAKSHTEITRSLETSVRGFSKEDPRGGRFQDLKSAIDTLTINMDKELRALRNSLKEEEQARKEGDQAFVSSSHTSMNLETKVKDERMAIRTSVADAFEKEAKDRKKAVEDMEMQLNDMRKTIDRNRALSEKHGSQLEKIQVEIINQQFKDLWTALETETAQRSAKDEALDTATRKGLENVARRQDDQDKDAQRSIAANKKMIEEERVARRDEIAKASSLMHSKLDDERKIRDVALKDVNDHLSSHKDMLASFSHDHADRHEESLKRWQEMTKNFEQEKKVRLDDSAALRRAQDSSLTELKGHMNTFKSSVKDENAGLTSALKQLREKNDTVAKDNARAVTDIYDKIKAESKERAARYEEVIRKHEQVSRAAEDEAKRRQKAETELGKRLDESEKQSQKYLEKHVAENTKKFDSLESKLTSDLKRLADEQSTQKKNMTDSLKTVQTEQKDSLAVLSKDINAKVQGTQQDQQSKTSAITRDIEEKIRGATSQFTNKLVGMSKDLTSQYQDAIQQEKRAREKALRDLTDTLDKRK